MAHCDMLLDRKGLDSLGGFHRMLVLATSRECFDSPGIVPNSNSVRLSTLAVQLAIDAAEVCGCTLKAL